MPYKACCGLRWMCESKPVQNLQADLWAHRYTPHVTIIYLFSTKLNSFSSIIQLVQTPLQGLWILPPYILPFLPTHLISKFNLWLMSIAVILDKYGDQDQFKTLQQDSEHTDTHHMQLSSAMRYSFSTKLSFCRSKLQLVQNPPQALRKLPHYNLPLVPTHLRSIFNLWLMRFSVT